MERQFGPQRLRNYSKLHSVWFRWKNTLLEIAGADSEPREQYDALCLFIEEKKMYFLKMLRRMN
jgi:hypothetical protein